jgi:DNA-binding PadR family transcriptional regulator
VRRKPGSIVPTERAVLEAGLQLHALGSGEFHGYALAKQMHDDARARTLIGHGTLYKALDRLEAMGLLTSRWEDPMAAAAESRPRRRFYRVTTDGSKALAAAVQAAPPGARLALNREPAP